MIRQTWHSRIGSEINKMERFFETFKQRCININSGPNTFSQIQRLFIPNSPPTPSRLQALSGPLRSQY
jgi:hypothetical protein